MTEIQSGMRGAQEGGVLPSMDLFPRVEYKGRTIDTVVFGSRDYDENVVAMQESHFHSRDLSGVVFRPLTTAESLAVAGYDFRNLAKPRIFDNNWLQAGRVLMTINGVWINPLRDDEGHIMMNKKKLERHLKKTKKVNGIYLLDSDTSFVPYDSFDVGTQEHGKFLEGGLARGLVHTPDKRATTLSSIANKEVYPKGVDVWKFEPVESPYLKVVRLGSGRGRARAEYPEGRAAWEIGMLHSWLYGSEGSDREEFSVGPSCPCGGVGSYAGSALGEGYLAVSGLGCGEDGRGRYGRAFGGLVSGEASAQKN